jgi:hypothetical protein
MIAIAINVNLQAAETVTFTAASDHAHKREMGLKLLHYSTFTLETTVESYAP